MYPEYYEIIEQPMDLTTIKERMHEYHSIEECLGDIRLVWDNCRQFNAEGSDILQSAEECSVLLETLVAVSFKDIVCSVYGYVYRIML